MAGQRSAAQAPGILYAERRLAPGWTLSACGSLRQHFPSKYLAELLLLASFQHRYQLFFSNLSRQRTAELVSALRLLDWSGGFKVSAIHETHHAIYKDLLAERRLGIDREMSTIMYHMPSSKAKTLQVTCPTGYYLDSVRVEHAELINHLWSARHVGSLKLIQLLIENNTSVGLYAQETGELCAWCLR